MFLNMKLLSYTPKSNLLKMLKVQCFPWALAGMAPWLMTHHGLTSLSETAYKSAYTNMFAVHLNWQQLYASLTTRLPYSVSLSLLYWANTPTLCSGSFQSIFHVVFPWQFQSQVHVHLLRFYINVCKALWAAAGAWQQLPSMLTDEAKWRWLVMVIVLSLSAI